MKWILAILAFALLAVTPLRLDSQIVIERYELEMTDIAIPKATIFSYSVSQAGTTDIEQRHRVYREGLDVRDETISVDGLTLKRKIVRVGRHEDRYTLARLAPRSASYEIVFVRAHRTGTRLDYQYDVRPIVAASSGFIVTGMTIDGQRFLPRKIAFRTSGVAASGTGEITFAPSGKYWVPVAVDVTAQAGAKTARERIVWSDYQFPPSLPRSTFQTPRQLPRATPPA